MFELKIRAIKDRARKGIFTTPNGQFETPVFMPVGTVGAVKGIAPWELKKVGAEIILANTYHLMLRPGQEIIKKHSGLHSFMKWKGPILTDSGGFQVFSLGSRLKERGIFKKKKPVKITNAGVEFYSHIDGKKIFLDAATSIKVQQDLGADIIMAFDECPAGDASQEYVDQAVNRTHDWLKKSKIAWTNRKNQALFGIVQGASYKTLREKSAKFVNDLDLPGNAIGGVATGETKREIWQAVDWSIDFLNPRKPRYLMGVGEPVDIITAVKKGCDMFDCVQATRLGRHGLVWKKENHKTGSIKKETLPSGQIFAYKALDLRLSRYKEDLQPIDPDCECLACSNGFSRSYLHHLLGENEMLGTRLMVLHNLFFIFQLLRAIRQSIG